MSPLCFSPFPTIKTPRLLLRQLESKDAESIFNYQSNKQHFPYVDMPVYTEREQASAYIEKMNAGIKTNQWIVWAIADMDTKEILGTVSLWNISIEDESAELGYGLFSEAIGKGIMSEALEGVLDYGFHDMGLLKIEAYTSVLNKKSIALLKRRDFSYSKTVEEPASNGELETMKVYSLTP